ncbi:MAG: hypothetical protein ACK500_04485 [Flavobacteriales bacterium]
MHKYQVIFVFLFVCSCFVALGQTNVSGSFGVIAFRHKGGFDHAKYDVESTAAMWQLGVSHFKPNKHIGVAAGFTFGNVGISWLNPNYYLCEQGPIGETSICQTRNLYRVQALFPSLQLSAGPAVRVGQFLEFAVSPFLGIHSRQGKYIMGLQPDIQLPATLSDMYTRFEWGGQARLTLRLNLGKRFSVHAQGHAGMTFSDLRQNDWQDARAIVLFSPEESDWVALPSSKLTRRFYGLSVGIGYKILSKNTQTKD